ncbi:MAG: DUF4981 domain-containing protein [Eubacteriales bacterium]|nr:DUF4981 domain-containing protein [Eubacteriales bacterium]
MNICVKDIQIKTSVENGCETGCLEALIRAEAGQEVFLWAQLLDSDGREADRIFPVALEAETSFRMEVPQVRLWNTEQPHLYDLVLELRDKDARLLGTTVKKAAFFLWKMENGVCWLNGRKMIPRVKEYAGEDVREIRRNNFNILLTDGAEEEEFRTLCLKCGIYGLPERQWQADGGSMENFCSGGTADPDIELQVVSRGILIENRKIFSNTAQYSLHCSVYKDGDLLSEKTIQADTPPGTALYLDFPLEEPGEPGEYVLEASFCLKKDTPWAKSGYKITSARCISSKLFSE